MPPSALRRRRPALRVLAALLPVLALSPAWRCGPPPPPPPHVLLIIADDLNTDVGAFGGPALTPNIDQLASSGYRFDAAHAVSPICSPTRVSLLTGQRPETHGQYQNDGNFRELPGGAARKTLPQLLRQRGYTTVAAGKIFHQPHGADPGNPDPLSDPASWDQQFVGDEGTPGAEAYLDEDGQALWLEGEAPFFYGDFAVWGPIPDAKEDTGDWMAGEFIRSFLEDPPPSTPMLLALGIRRPHTPLLAPQEFFDLYPIEEVEVPFVPPDDLLDVPPAGQWNFTTPLVELMRDKGEWEQAVQGYLASVSFADAVVGNVLDALDSGPWAAKTLVVFLGDHGHHLGDKDRFGKLTNWSRSTQVPLVIRKPGQSAGVAVEGSVSQLDLLPTLLDLLGVPAPAALEGRSVKPLMETPGLAWTHPAVVTHQRFVALGQLETDHSVQLGHWNYIRYWDGSEELYDRDGDPAEFENLAGDPAHEDVRRHLATELQCMAMKRVSPDLTLEEVDALGDRRIESFDGGSGDLDAEPGWTTQVLGDDGQGGAQDFALAADVVDAPGGDALATQDELALPADHGFLLSLKTRPGGGGAGGLVFGFEGTQDAFELLVVDGAALGGPAGQDLRLVRRAAGQESWLLFESALPNLDPAAWHWISVEYDAFAHELEIQLLDPLRATLWRRKLMLDAALPAGSLFGVASHDSPAQGFDDWSLFVFPQSGGDLDGDAAADAVACDS